MNRKERRKQKKVSAQSIPNQNELLEAIEFHRQKKFDNAEKLYQKIIANNQENYQALRHLGILYHDNREYLKATQYLEKAIKVQPSLPDAYNNLGSVYFVNDEIEPAKNLFEKSFQLNNSYLPKTILDGFLTEPIVLTMDNNSKIHCLTNVCTHRGNIVAIGPGKSKKLTCCYHGRTFELDGSFRSMPEFEETKNFPTENDNLHSFPVEKWGPFIFAGLNPSFDFKNVLNASRPSG